MKTTAEKRRERQKEHRTLNPEMWRGRQERYRVKVRKASLEILGGKCARCGFDDVRALQIDHIHGGGSADLNRQRGAQYNVVVIRSVLKNEDIYQLLCANCNWIKRAENNEARARHDV